MYFCCFIFRLPQGLGQGSTSPLMPGLTLMNNNDPSTKAGNSVVRKRNSPVSPSGPDGDAPRTMTSPMGTTTRSRNLSNKHDDDDEAGALNGASGRGLMEGELRSDYVLHNSSQADLGLEIGTDLHLTLLDEVVLLGLKDQQV